MNADEASLGPVERLHPLFLITGLGGSLRQASGAIAALAYITATGNWDLLVIIVPALLVALLAGLFIYWRFFEFRVGTAEIHIDHGLLRRVHRSIPFDRIQDVDISQPLLARAFGLARVRFETGGSGGATDDDGVLHAIALSRAEALRALIRSRRGTTAEEPAATTVEPAPLYAMDRRRLLLAGLFNFSLAVLAGLFGLSQTVGDVAGFDPFSRQFWRDALDAGSPLLDLILVHRIAAAFAGLLMLVFIGLATGVLRTLLREYGFRLDRSGSGLRRRRGLLTLTDVTLPLKRVQAAIIGTGPLRNRFGWRDLRLQSLGKDEGSKGDHIVAPLANDAEVSAILTELDWRALDPMIEWQRTSPAYFWSSSLAVSLLLVPATIQFFFIAWLGAGGYAVVAVLVATRWLDWRRYRYALDGDRLLVRSGWWKRRLVILPLANIQSVDLTESVVSRRFGTASLTIGVASGRGYSSHGIASLPRETARALRDRLLTTFA